jgi:ABC-type branched-subunit amino acid transport system substrate-binding protein
VKQAREAGYKGHTATSQTVHDVVSFTKIAGVENSIGHLSGAYPIHGPLAKEFPAFSEWKDKYTKRWGKYNDLAPVFNAYANATFRPIEAGANIANSLKPEKIRDALETPGFTFDSGIWGEAGYWGEVWYGQSHAAMQGYFIAEIVLKGGKPVHSSFGFRNSHELIELSTAVAKAWKSKGGQ